MDVVVIGAGMTGLTAARRLRDAGAGVVVLDKGRAVGGRMASRRFEGARFDHGAQHFGARSPEFREEVDGWHRAGVVSVWYHAGPDGSRPGEARWVGRPSMRSICEHLTDGLDVHTAETVREVRVEQESVSVVTSRAAYVGRAAILTPPAPQVLALLPAMPQEAAVRLRAVEYEPCLAGLAVLDGPSGLPDGHLLAGDGPVDWVADNTHKGVSARPAVTIHASAAFSRDRLEATPDRWLPDLLECAAPHLASPVVEATGHRWRYARPVRPTDEGLLVIGDDPPVVVAGEAFAGARVEGAFRSGLEAARFVGERLAR